ncbi:PREDICTED: uncharacterized protein LOC104602042 [Nelumbo nucifera]|uniref:Uncharacterized protein LOC104602042 n=2 Tax=Nelumbo nucifera TaxID=4432 RepID=A0A1U8AEC5_NELNU|nr:PREDICTED: uncharacterized protein LOC104602042 [Nelumbo nucifera]DAD46952.1 TPA_asm: hypothetical protein HUJ06_016889 [Nelumbo nucifera]
MDIREELENSALPFLSLNHVSFLCKSVTETAKFYQEVLGFVLVKRPSSFDFEGAWLFNYGIGIHLLQCDSVDDVLQKPSIIKPKDNHISFQCTDVELVKRKLEEMGMKYVTAVDEEGEIKVDQLFFHDPDGYMIEICNCEKLPVLPLSSCSLKRSSTWIPPSRSIQASMISMKALHSTELGTRMMENLVTNMADLAM